MQVLISLVVAVGAVSGCAATQSPGTLTADTSPCPEPAPPPEPPLVRLAAAFFEAVDIASWARSFEHDAPPPTGADVIEHLQMLVEVMLQAEMAAAEGRAYEAAEMARLDGEALLLLLLERGGELPPGLSPPRQPPVGEEERVSELENPTQDVTMILDDVIVVADNIQSIASEVASLEAERAGDRGAQKNAECLAVRIDVYLELEDIHHMLGEDIEQASEGAAEDEETQRELARNRAELELALALLTGCREGMTEARIAADQILQRAGLLATVELEDIARDIIGVCG